MKSVQTNSAISVDCVIFGFDGENLKALLVRRRNADPLYDDGGHKLPGAMIRENETLPEAAARVLEASTGLKDLYLKQTSIFSDPDRVDHSELQKDILWSPIAFNLLPKKFTVRQLQNLLEAVFGIELDNRNFRKKLFSAGVLVETDEYEKHVSHKPARLYQLNKSLFSKKNIVNFSTFARIINI